MNEEIAALSKRLENATGQIAALTIATRALLTTHPAKDLAAQRFHDEFEQTFSIVLPRPYPEGFVDGLQMVRKMFLKP
jgi:hypothetical protein